MVYRLWVLLHLVGVAAFFSNAVAALFWKHRAEKLREPAVVAHTFRALVAADLWITPLAVAAIMVGGVGSSMTAGIAILNTGWILWSFIAFLASGLFAAIGAWPSQRALAEWTTSALYEREFDWDRYDREARRWARWAHVSLAAAALAMALMVLKPDLPAL